jgi:serine/threonine protein kinase
MPNPPSNPGTAGVGQLLGGRYRLERIVGHGAMGRVWAAHDLVLNRAVAIKQVDFPPGMPAAELDQVAARTMREARAVASVSDPHVVTIFDLLPLPQGPAIVMELLSARSLAEILAADGPLTDTDAATVGLSVSAGLLAAHAAGIIHRDVKPGNVLICTDGRIKLTDFGIARATGEQTITATGLLLGSPAFISPEVASGEPADARTDAWGLGALLFACMQGVPPYDRGTPLATLAAVVADPVPPHPRSGRLSGIIRGLLMKDPAVRMSVATAHQSLLHIATDTGRLVTHRLKPPPAPVIASPPLRRPAAVPAVPAVGAPQRLPAGAGWSAQPALPPPPWANAGGAAALRPLPVRAGERTRRQRVLLAVIALLVGVVAALAGFFVVRVIAHVQTGIPIISFSAPAYTAHH